MPGRALKRPESASKEGRLPDKSEKRPKESQKEQKSARGQREPERKAELPRKWTPRRFGELQGPLKRIYLLI